MSEIFCPNMYVTAWDDVTHTTPEEREHAECEPLAHTLTCDCEACEPERLRATWPPVRPNMAECPRCGNLDYPAALQRRGNICGQCARTEAKGGTIKKALAGAALLATLLLPAHASAHEYPVIGTPAYDASCQVVTEWEGGGALAYCEEDGETYLFDADGFFYNDNGIRFYGRPPGTWYVAPERLQIGPGAPVDAR
jgi:ribosomal protein S27AE